jgi:hypothetical protein
MIVDIARYLKSIFSAPSAETIALRELEESRREILAAQSAREYADSLCRYHDAKIKRLSAYLRDAHAATLLGDITK